MFGYALDSVGAYASATAKGLTDRQKELDREFEKALSLMSPEKQGEYLALRAIMREYRLYRKG